MEVQIVRVCWNGDSRLIHLWAGCPAWEIRDVIQSAFRTASTPVALVSEASGVIVPLSVACRYPQTLEKATTYGVLQSENQDAFANSRDAKAESLRSPPPLDEEEEEEEEEEEGPPQAQAQAQEEEDYKEEEADEKVEKLTELVSKFAKLLETSGKMTEEEAQTVREFADQRDPVVLAAYSVAAADQNADQLGLLLTKVARDFLKKTDSFDGAAEHAAMGRLLRVVDDMYASEAFDLTRCRSLQRLILAKDPAVFSALENCGDGDAKALFESLLRAEPNLVDERRFAVFQECAKWLVDKDLMSAEDAQFVLESTTTAPFLEAAFDDYAQSNDLEAFLDALAAFASSQDKNPTKDTVVLTECLAWLRDKAIVDEAQTVALLEAARDDKDPRLQKALADYASSNDLGQFLETLSLLARLVVVAPSSRQKEDEDDDDFWDRDDDDDHNNDAEPPAAPENDDAPNAYDDAAARDDDVAVLEIGKLVECLAKDGKLRDAEQDRLASLLADRDPRLLAAFDVYCDAQDVDDLVDTLLRLSQKSEDDDDDALDELDREAVRQLPSNPDGGGDDDDDDDPFTTQDDDDAPQAEFFATFLSAFEKIAATQLSEVEAASLQLAAARNDSLLADALKDFQKNPDQSKLIDAFKHVANNHVANLASEDVAGAAADPQ